MVDLFDLGFDCSIITLNQAIILFMGIGLCTSFWRNSPSVSILRRFSPRLRGSFYFTREFRNLSWSLMLSYRFQVSLNLTRIALICTSYKSLYLLSSLSLVSLCGLLFIVARSVVGARLTEKSYLLQSYTIDIFQNAYIFSSELAYGIMQGLNFTYMKTLVCCQMRSFIKIGGIALTLTGRIKGINKTRIKVNALCVGEFTNRILDYGCVSTVSSLGSIGIKVGTIW